MLKNPNRHGLYPKLEEFIKVYPDPIKWTTGFGCLPSPYFFERERNVKNTCFKKREGGGERGKAGRWKTIFVGNIRIFFSPFFHF